MAEVSRRTDPRRLDQDHADAHHLAECAAALRESLVTCAACSL
jgi:hypothetical protein